MNEVLKAKLKLETLNLQRHVFHKSLEAEKMGLQN